MRKSVVLSVVVLLGLAFLGLALLAAAEKTVTLPKGTKAEKLGSGNVRFVLPNGQKVEVKGYDPKTGILGDCGVYDKGKLVMSGSRGSLTGIIEPDPPSIIRAPKQNACVLVGGELVSLKAMVRVPHADYVLIDDEVTWLPATVQFKSGAAGKTELSPQPDPPGMVKVTLPKGTTAAKLGAGHFKFSLPGGRSVEVNGYDPKTGILGDCGVYEKGKLMTKGSKGSLTGIIDPAPPDIIRAPKQNTYVLVGGELASLKTLAKVPHSDYVMIDDEVTWLPITIKFN
jgi:hypothetical protein